MINSFIGKTFGYNRNKSLTKDYEEISHRINDNKQFTKIKIKIWDSPSSEGYKPIVISQIKFTHGLLLVYDITNIQSFLHLDEWMKTIINNKEINKYPVLLVGNKIDLQEKREVTFEQAKSFANKYNIQYYETSAKTKQGIKEVFLSLINEVYYQITYTLPNITYNDFNIYHNQDYRLQD